jgi:hypothetical protein
MSLRGTMATRMDRSLDLSGEIALRIQNETLCTTTSAVGGLVVTCDQIAKTPVSTGVLAVRSRLTQALGRLPWFAPFFLRARRLRPVLPI